MEIFVWIREIFFFFWRERERDVGVKIEVIATSDGCRNWGKLKWQTVTPPPPDFTFVSVTSTVTLLSSVLPALWLYFRQCYQHCDFNFASVTSTVTSLSSVLPAPGRHFRQWYQHHDITCQWYQHHDVTFVSDTSSANISTLTTTTTITFTTVRPVLLSLSPPKSPLIPSFSPPLRSFI